nr:MAG TPA: hypothetical protein [Crassvirales sp.]
MSLISYTKYIKLKLINMIVDLKQCVNPDSTFDVYFEGLKAVISHDLCVNAYHCIIVDVHSDRCCEITPLPRIMNTDKYKIFPRKGTCCVQYSVNQIVKP